MGKLGLKRPDVIGCCQAHRQSPILGFFTSIPEVRDANKYERAQKLILGLLSKDGLNLNTEKVRRAADHTNKGAGSIKAATKDRKRYNSKDKAKKVTIPNKEIQNTATPSLISTLYSRIFKP